MKKKYYITENYDIIKGSTTQSYEIEDSKNIDEAIEEISNTNPYHSDTHVEDTDFINRTVFSITTEIDKMSENKTNSFWYFNQQIAFAEPEDDNRKFVIESRGAIEVMLEESGEGIFYKGQQAVDRAEELDYDDENLNYILEYDGWRNNNWFAIVEVDKDGNVISDDLGIAHNYDESFKVLQEIMEEIVNE